MPVLKNSKHEKFCQLIAKGETGTAAYVSVGYSKKTARVGASILLTKPNIKARIANLQEKISASLLNKSISIKAARLDALNDRWLKMQQVIAERAVDPDLQDIAGGKTGLLCHDQKGVGAGPAAEVIDVYQVDTGLLKELREHEVQAAKELGQWIEKGEITGADGGPMSFTIDGVAGAEWLRKSD